MVSMQNFAQMFTNQAFFVLRKVTPLCSFCCNEEETLLLLFWECPVVQTFSLM